jgi:hypothetical protein
LKTHPLRSIYKKISDTERYKRSHDPRFQNPANLYTQYFVLPDEFYISSSEQLTAETDDTIKPQYNQRNIIEKSASSLAETFSNSNKKAMGNDDHKVLNLNDKSLLTRRDNNPLEDSSLIVSHLNTKTSKFDWEKALFYSTTSDREKLYRDFKQFVMEKVNRDELVLDPGTLDDFLLST